MRIVHPSEAEIRTWGHLTKALHGAFGSGHPWLKGEENVGSDGHLDLFHPCRWSDVEFQFARYEFSTAEVEAAKEEGHNNPFVFHVLAYKLKKGLFRGSHWVAVICLNYCGRRVIFGWLSSTSMDGLMTEYESWMHGERATSPDMETELSDVR